MAGGRAGVSERHLPRAAVIGACAACGLLLASVATGALAPWAWLTHAVFDVVGALVAAATLLLASLHFSLKRDETLPALAIAALGASLIDLLHWATAAGASAAPSRVAATWLLSRSLSALLLLATIAILRSGRRARPLADTTLLTGAVVATALLFFALLPEAGPDAPAEGVLMRPLQLFPLLGFVIAGVLARGVRARRPSAFMDAVLVAVAASGAAQVAAALAHESRDPFLVGAHALAAIAPLVLLGAASLDFARAWAAANGPSEDAFHVFADTASDAIVTMDERGRILFANRAAARIFGHPLESLVGKSLTVLIPAYLRDAHSTSLRHYLATGQRHFAWDTVELPGLHADGHLIPLEISLGELRQRGKRLFFGIARDVSARKNAERALKESEERHALAMQGAKDGLWDWNLGTNDVYFSARCRALLAWGDGDGAASPEAWYASILPDDLESFKAAVNAHLEGRTTHLESEHRVVLPDGTVRWMLVRGSAITDARGRPSRMAGSLTDITERREDQERLRHEALHDALTGLANRSFLLDKIRHAMNRARRRPEQGFGILFIDLDRFKVINDSLGHVRGDELLVEFSRRLESCLRPDDMAARLGGDEFVALLDRIADPADAERVARCIQEELKRPFLLGGEEVFTSASIGIAMHAPRYGEPQDLLRDADTAMYAAKAGGRARHVVFEPGMHAKAVTLLEVETDLRRAVERGEFRLLYRPVVALDTGHVAFLESQLGWERDGGTSVLPESVLTVAEQSGLVIPIGAWVVETACRDLAAWRAKGQDAGVPAVSVSVFGRQLAQPDFVAQLETALAGAGVERGKLLLEIPERVLLGGSDLASRSAWELQSLGFRLIVDGFGASFASLGSVPRLPVDLVKLDRAVVERLGRSPEDAALVEAVVRQARVRGIRVVAGGVETEEQLGHLRAIGCDLASGDHCGPPVAADQVVAVLGEGVR